MHTQNIGLGFYYRTCTMRKRGVLQLALQLNFWIAEDIATHCIYDAIHYNSIKTQLKQLIFNYYATPLQLHSCILQLNYSSYGGLFLF